MISLRVDDFLTTKPDEAHVHTLDAYRRFHEVVERRVGRRYLLGIIPSTAGDEALAWAVSQPSILRGVHGIDHDESRLNQFDARETEAEVERKLRRAAHVVRVSHDNPGVYIPPHNVVDYKTVRALWSSVYDALTAGPGSDENVLGYASSLGLGVLRSTWPEEYGRSDELMSRDASVEHMHENAPRRTIYLTLHFPWENNIGLSSVDEYLARLDGLFEDFVVDRGPDLP